jgi:hypothetical protein
MIAILLCAGAAHAQSRRGGDERDDAKQQRRAPASAAEAQERASDQAQMQLNQARRALHLTPAQGPLYDVFQDRVVAMLDDMNRGVPPTTAEDTALKQIDRRVDLLRNRLAALEDVADAARRLYAALTPEQKQTADRVLPGTLPAMYQQISPFRGDGAVRERYRQ